MIFCKQPTRQSVQRNISSKVGCDVEESYEVEKRPGIDNQGILHRSMIKWHGANSAQNGENVFQHAKHFGRDFQLQYIPGKRWEILFFQFAMHAFAVKCFISSLHAFISEIKGKKVPYPAQEKRFLNLEAETWKILGTSKLALFS